MAGTVLKQHAAFSFSRGMPLVSWTPSSVCLRRRPPSAGLQRGGASVVATNMALRLPKDFAFRDCQSATIDAAFAETLGTRLGAVASFVQEGAKVLDVGTDHGRLPIGLVKSGKAQSVIAGDVNRGPMVNAQKSVAVERLEVASKISVRLGDGLAVLKDGDEVDTVTISGIGGVTIARILFGPLGVYPDSDVAVTEWSSGKDLNGVRTVNDLGVQRLVLQPTSGWPSLRRTLLCQGWDIVDECIHSEVCSNSCGCVCACASKHACTRTHEHGIIPFRARADKRKSRHVTTAPTHTHMHTRAGGLAVYHARSAEEGKWCNQ